MPKRKKNVVKFPTSRESPAYPPLNRMLTQVLNAMVERDGPMVVGRALTDIGAKLIAYAGRQEDNSALTPEG